MATHPAAMEATRLSKVFGTRVVLDNVDQSVAEGECVALVGANGSGKTTLLRCLASRLRPSAGEVRWFGRPARADPAARRLIGMVAHESCLYAHLTLRDNLVFAARMGGVPNARRRADQWLGRIGLACHAERLPNRISRGMRQRVALARALIHEPRILLLDEPFAGLDAGGADWLVRLLAELRDGGRTLCFAVHDTDKVRRLASRIFHLHCGRLAEVGVDGPEVPAEFWTRARAA